MKVLHLISTLSAGGAELHLLTLCRYLKQYGVDLIVACLREHVLGSRSLRSDFEQNGVCIVNLLGDSRYDWRFVLRLADLLKKEQPQILHSHLPRADIAAAFARTWRQAPLLLCSVHGIYRDEWFGSWAAPLMRWAYRQSDGIIPCSFAVRDWLSHDLNVTTEKLQVIHYGIEWEQFAMPQGSGNTREGETSPKSTIGSAGRLEPGKGFDCLIRSMSQVHQQLPNARLLIAGRDTSAYAHAVRSQIVQLRLDGIVQLLGFQEDIPAFLQTIDIFAFASRSEGFGLVVAEAMAAGKPVVASRIPALTEIVVDGETGFLVDPDDSQAFAEAIMTLLIHPEKARRMGKLGQERVQHLFSAERMAQQTLALYGALDQYQGSVGRTKDGYPT